MTLVTRPFRIMSVVGVAEDCYSGRAKIAMGPKIDSLADRALSAKVARNKLPLYPAAGSRS